MNTLGQLKTYIQNEFNDTSTSVGTLIELLSQVGIDQICSKTAYEFDMKSISRTTVASQSAYNLAADHRKMDSLVVTVGSIPYYPQKILSDRQWEGLVQGRPSTTSDVPQFYRVKNGTIEIFPTPASSGNTITINYYGYSPRLVTADFTDQSDGVVSVSASGTVVTGVSTSFLSTDVGRSIRFDTGDKYFYRIASRSSSTAITLSQAYEGATVSGGSYLLGTVPRIAKDHPEAMFVLANFILWRLWIKREEVTAAGGKASHFKEEYQNGARELMMQIQNQFADGDAFYLEEHEDIYNPNLFPNAIS